MTPENDSETLRALHDARPSIVRLAEQMEACISAYKTLDEPGLAFRVGMLSQALYDYAEALRVAYERRVAKEAEEL